MSVIDFCFCNADTKQILRLASLVWHGQASLITVTRRIYLSCFMCSTKRHHVKKVQFIIDPNGFDQYIKSIYCSKLILLKSFQDEIYYRRRVICLMIDKHNYLNSLMKLLNYLLLKCSSYLFLLIRLLLFNVFLKLVKSKENIKYYIKNHIASLES